MTISKLFSHLIIICLFLLAGNSLNLFAQQPDAQEDPPPSCFVDLGDIVFPVTTLCANEPLPIPCVDFNTTEGPAGLMWAVYSCQPGSADPFSDPCSATYNVLLSNQNGDPIFSCGQDAFFENANILNGIISSVTVVLVPIINVDTTDNLPGVCTGIVPGFIYPTITFIDPDLNPEICDSECGGLTEENDNCSGAVELVLAPDVYGNFSNVCSTSIDDPNVAPDCFADDDPYQATVWFTFTGNGGTYTINTLNCSGSAQPQLTDSQMALFAGSCTGTLSLVACNDDSNGLLASVEEFTTVAGQTYYLLVDGYENLRGEFCIEILEITPPPVCDADLGTITPAEASTICQSEGITYNAAGAATTGYTSYFAVVNTATGNIVTSVASTTFTAVGTALGAGSFTVHALNIANEDLSAITPFPATAAQLIAALANPDVCHDFDAAGIALNILPTPNATATSNSPLCEGNTIQLFGSTATPGTPTFNWSGPGGFTSAAQNPEIAAANPAMTGTYILTVSINGCQSAPQTVGVVVNTIPAATAGNSSPVCEGETVALFAETGATGTVSYNWNGPNGFTSTAQNPSITTAEATDSGTYTVVVTANGCAGNPAETTVTVTAAPSVLIVNNNPTACQGTCASLSATVDGDAAYTWSGPNGFTSNEANLEFCDITPEFSGTYCVSAVVNGCESELACTDITVLLPDDPACAELCLADAGIVFVDDPGVCPGDTLFAQVFGATGGDYTTLFLFTDDLGNILQVQPDGVFVWPISGSYEICTINFSPDAADSINSILTLPEPTMEQLQIIIPITPLCAEISAPVVVTVLGQTSIGCFNCEADGGTVTYPSDTNVCANGITEPLVITANNTNPGYLTYLVITDAITTQILAYTPESVIDWAALGLTGASYTVHVINFAVEFQAQIETALNSAFFWNDFLFVVGDSGYCFEVSESVVIFVVTPADVSPCSETCFANFGTVTPPTDTELCPGELATPATITGAATSGYATMFLLTALDGGSLTIAGTGNTSEFECPGSGTYFVHALNYANIDAVLVQSAIVVGSNVASLLFNLNATDVCYDLDLNGYALNCLEAAAITCLDPIAVINLTETPNPNGLTYTVSFTVIGGSGNYIINGNPSGSNFTSQPIDCGLPYTFEITDDLASGVLIVSGVSPCVCPTNPGNMPNLLSPAPVCNGGSVTLTSLNPVLIPGDVLIYVLHDGTENTLGNILSTNSDGNFGADDAADIQTNTVYYIAPVAGPSDAGGNLIWNSECTKVGTGAPVVFLNPITYQTDENCDWLTGDYSVTLFPAGGLPQFDSSQPYFINGDAANVEVYFGNSFTTVFPNGSTTVYAFYITDSACDAEAVASESFVCIKTPIQLLNFKGEVQPRGNLLTWTTATETDNDFFALERSENGTAFTRIATIDGAGNSNTAKNYEYLDKEAPAGTAYYRLVQTDFNGTTNTSEVIALRRPDAGFSFNAIYPVPADKFVELNFNAEADTPVSVEVYDLAGKLITSLSVFAQRGSNVYTIDVADYSAGMYFITLNNGKDVISNRFVKK
ncbi:T9SS C-terminal target domain-containing protein [Sphingobacteriales bacterium UPWRP_1]|nr:hypothetical protein BVG80_14510 [Sphingobacteriales bacterium TSM_CSM]PSJ76611.1 T9SS C-terminal target domain-containing protein [Sphingobacteriales bacterium UPWRP_1]